MKMMSARNRFLLFLVSALIGALVFVLQHRPAKPRVKKPPTPRDATQKGIGYLGNR